MRFFGIISVLVLLTTILISQQAFSQKKEQESIVQFSGIVTGENQAQLPGVHIYVPKSGRGTTSNIYGYFSMAVLVGDSMVFSSVGYEKYSLVIPGGNERVNVLVNMIVDTTYLENVDIMPFLSEENFKLAILALELPDVDEEIYSRLDGAALAMMIQNAPYDAAMNARYYLKQQIYYQQDKFMPRSNPLLNPFAWAQFFKSLKKDKKK
ncbi:MAG: carboxypeptidase-like regulatory domain-containing protein [Bacteroidetes bacterium]|nr:carboxypeptidase-like regulatory domain-containing protein [Bacteroidota bacterium]